MSRSEPEDDVQTEEGGENIDVLNWISEYWKSSERRLDRRFYISYAILSTVIMDYAIGLKYMKEKIHSWSIISLYYSMVHSLRLMLFNTLGDFPRYHDTMIKFLKGQTDWEWPKASWLRKWREYDPDGLDEINRQWGSSRDMRLTSVQFIEGLKALGFDPSIETRIGRYGEILEKTKQIRNLVNYEGLIMAHESLHHYLGPCIREGTRLLGLLTSKMAEDSVKSFILFVENEGISYEQRSSWVSFLLVIGDKNYGLYRLLEILDNVYGIGDHVVSKVKEIIQPIYKLNDRYRIDEKGAKRFFSNVEYSVFKGKRGMIGRFMGTIKDLLHTDIDGWNIGLNDSKIDDLCS